MIQGAVDILFEGSKYFGNTKTLFHIAIVEHSSHDVIEVVSYDKRYSVEAPSLYLTYSTLLLRIDGNAVTQRIFDLREEADERGIMEDQNKIIKIALGEAIFDFLSDRLFACPTGVNRAKLEFKLLKKDRISMSVRNPLCAKPDKLEPFSYASVLISEDKGLSCREKWSMPVMLAKVARSRSLQERDTKAYNEHSLLLPDSDAETISSALFSTVSMTNSDAGGQEGACAFLKSQRWTLSQRPFLNTAEVTTPADQDQALSEQCDAQQRKGSISAGYGAIILSLQRGLSVMHGTSIKSSKVAVSTSGGEAGDIVRAGSAKHFTAASFGSDGSVGSLESEGSRMTTARHGGGGHGTTMMSRALSRRMMELAREAGASIEADVEPVVDPLAGLSPCDRANYELRAARYMAKLAANAAASGKNVLNTSLDLYVDTAAGTRVGTPRNDAPSSPSVRLQQAVASLRNGMGGLLHPVLRLLQAAGRGSTTPIAAEN